MIVGDIITTRNIRHYFEAKKAKGWKEYKAETGKNMVFLYLGQEPKDGSKPLNIGRAMNELGWITALKIGTEDPPQE